MAIRYTVTTHTRSCPWCGNIVEKYSTGFETPLIACLGVLFFPVMIAYITLRFLAFSGAIQEDIGKKYDYCPNCYKIINTGNHYVDELYGEYLLNYKYTPLFYLSYLLGSVILYALLFGISDSFTPTCVWTIIISVLLLLPIITVYRWLLIKFRLQNDVPAEKIPIIERNKNKEYHELVDSIQKKIDRENDLLVEKYRKTIKTKSEQELLIEKLEKHKQWLQGEKIGEQLILCDYDFSNCQLNGLRMQKAILKNCKFNKMDLTKTSFRKCDLSGAKFIKCNLDRTDFTGATIEDDSFVKCNTEIAIFF